MAAYEDDPDGLPTPNELSLNSEAAARLEHPALLDALHAGDEEAYNTIYLAYAAMLLRFAYSYVGSHAVAEDVVADTFVHLWERRAEIAPRFGLKAYLFAAVHNRARKVLRTDQRFARMVDRVQQDTSDDSADLPDIESSIDASVLNVTLRNAVAQLPEDRRRLIALRWYEGLTVPQIAHVLGLSVGAVEQRLLRTLNTLRKVLDSRP